MIWRKFHPLPSYSHEGKNHENPTIRLTNRGGLGVTDFNFRLAEERFVQAAVDGDNLTGGLAEAL